MDKSGLVNTATKQEYIKQLKAVAEQQTQDLKARDNVIGIFLYGSLARGQAIIDSDVDLVVVLDKPKKGPQFERHLRGNIRVDLSFFSVDQGKKLAAEWKENILLSRGFLELMHSGDFGKILYDPTGEVNKLKTLLLKKLCSQRWILPRALKTFHQAQQLLSTSLNDSDPESSLQTAKKAAEGFGQVVCQLAVISDLSEAASQLHVPQLYNDYQSIKAVFSSDRSVSEREAKKIYLASKEFLEYCWDQISEPLEQILANQGVEDIDRLRLQSIDPFLGPYTFELKRAVKDVYVNLNRAGFFLSQGEYQHCVQLLPPDIKKWYTELANGLRNKGWEGHRVVDDFLNSAEFRNRYKELVSLRNKLDPKEQLTPQQAKCVVSWVQDMEESVAKVVNNLLHPDTQEGTGCPRWWKDKLAKG